MSCIGTGARHGGCSKIKMLAGAGALLGCGNRLEWTPLVISMALHAGRGLTCAHSGFRCSASSFRRVSTSDVTVQSAQCQAVWCRAR